MDFDLVVKCIESVNSYGGDFLFRRNKDYKARLTHKGEAILIIDEFRAVRTFFLKDRIFKKHFEQT